MAPTSRPLLRGRLTPRRVVGTILLAIPAGVLATVLILAFPWQLLAVGGVLGAMVLGGLRLLDPSERKDRP